MWRHDPRCYWCGVQTILRPLHIPHEPLPPAIRDRVATLDHVRARHHPDRLKRPESGDVLHVLSCWRCNNERDRQQLQAKPKEYLHDKCGNKPLDQRSLEELEQLLAFLQSHAPYHPTKRAKRRDSIKAVAEAIHRRIGGAAEDNNIGGVHCWFVMEGEPVCEHKCQGCDGIPHHWIPDVSDKHPDGALVCKHCPAWRSITDVDDLDD
ncbi:MAG: hypothetical protein MOB07_24265 [Acidobacteria bacterium]|nr:hypothetical protein [Acidobacteriota bacterium]